MVIYQKVKTSTAQNQTQLQGDNIRNYHAQLSTVLQSFRTSKSRLRGVTLPIGPLGVMTVDIIPCILFVIQDMQEGGHVVWTFLVHTRGKFNANLVCAMSTTKIWHVTTSNVNICMRHRCT